jgi:spore maturation protein CgeB
MDIMGAGGFLLTNFQADFLDFFVPDEDFVYYNDPEDLLNKIDYYLSHEKERMEIAQNGHQKVKQHHSFEKCFQNMLRVI